MATIKNQKRKALAFYEAPRAFPNGVMVIRTEDGLALVTDRDNKSGEMYWIDCRPFIGMETANPADKRQAKLFDDHVRHITSALAGFGITHQPDRAPGRPARA